MHQRQFCSSGSMIHDFRMVPGPFSPAHFVLSPQYFLHACSLSRLPFASDAATRAKVRASQPVPTWTPLDICPCFVPSQDITYSRTSITSSRPVDCGRCSKHSTLGSFQIAINRIGTSACSQVRCAASQTNTSPSEVKPYLKMALVPRTKANTKGDNLRVKAGRKVCDNLPGKK